MMRFENKMLEPVAILHIEKGESGKALRSSKPCRVSRSIVCCSHSHLRVDPLYVVNTGLEHTYALILVRCVGSRIMIVPK
jgi:hypothetical protein